MRYHNELSITKSRQEAESRRQTRQEAIYHVVSAGNKRSRTVSTEANYNGQSRQESKTGGLACVC